MAKTSGGIRGTARRANETPLQFYKRRQSDLNHILRKAESKGQMWLNLTGAMAQLIHFIEAMLDVGQQIAVNMNICRNADTGNRYRQLK